MDAETDLSADEMRQYVADLLNQQMAHPAFQLQPDQVRSTCIQTAGIACSVRAA